MSTNKNDQIKPVKPADQLLLEAFSTADEIFSDAFREWLAMRGFRPSDLADASDVRKCELANAVVNCFRG